MTEREHQIRVLKFEAAVDRRMSAGMTRGNAIRDAVTKLPKMHAAYIESYNALRHSRPLGGR